MNKKMTCKSCAGISIETKNKKMLNVYFFSAANLVPPAKDLPEDGEYKLFEGEGSVRHFRPVVMYSKSNEHA